MTTSRFTAMVMLLLILGVASLPVPGTASIIGISIPVDSQDAESYPLNEGVWSVRAPPYPLSTAGIGHIIVPGLPGLSLHDHHYVAANVPDPTRAVVTYHFDVATIVKGLEIVQQHNGITQIEGYYGNSPASLSSLGAVFGPSGDITGWYAFSDGEVQTFDFGNTSNAGTYFQFIVRKTSLDVGYANYNAFPLDVNGNQILGAVPLPPAVWLLGSGLLGLATLRRKLGKRG
jgi:hypothetical protein